ncbi:hypothetical protein FQN54_000892 [Arachnomyces sp. PD_36]|nr:hypothetical protein FQN54_000892 [Arachnomyces sp. PD_36]
MSMGDSQPRRFLIQMSGYPGSGKSTIVKMLSREISGVVIDHDVNKSAILESGHSWQLASKLAYGVGWDIANFYLKNELSVLIDSACFYSEIIKSGQDLAQRHNVEYWYIECKVDDTSILESRLQTRTSHRSQRMSINRLPLDIVDDAVTEDPGALFTKEPVRPHKNCIIVDSSDEKEKVLASITERLGL